MTPTSEAVTDPRDLPEVTGVYLLTHLVTGDTYVGSSANVRNRVFGHLSSLRLGNHTSRTMRDHAKEHGTTYSMCVLEIVDPMERYEAERRWIAKLKPTLNRGKPPTRLPRAIKQRVSFPARIQVDTANRLRKFCAEHSLHPKPSQVINAALQMLLEKEGY